MIKLLFSLLSNTSYDRCSAAALANGWTQSENAEAAFLMACMAEEIGTELGADSCVWSCFSISVAVPHSLFFTPSPILRQFQCGVGMGSGGICISPSAQRRSSDSWGCSLLWFFADFYIYFCRLFNGSQRNILHFSQVLQWVEWRSIWRGRGVWSVPAIPTWHLILSHLWTLCIPAMHGKFTVRQNGLSPSCFILWKDWMLFTDKLIKHLKCFVSSRVVLTWKSGFAPIQLSRLS